MKLLLVGDLHFKSKDANNIQDLERLSQFLIETAASIQDLDRIILLGDTLDHHEKIEIPQLVRATKLIEKLSDISHVILLIGNHDRINPDEFLTELSPFYPLKRWSNVTVVDDVKTDNVNGKKLLYVPYVPKGRFIEAIETKLLRKEWIQYDLIFAHQDFNDCEDNHGFKVSDGDKWSLDYPPVYSGHIHKYQKLVNGVTMVGTPYQTRQGEDIEKHILLLDGGKEVYIQTNIRKKIKKIVDYSDLSDLVLSDYEMNNQIELVIRCTNSESKTIKKLKKIKELKKLSEADSNFKMKVSTKIIIDDNIDKNIETEQVYETKDNFFKELEKIVIDDEAQVNWLYHFLGSSISSSES